MLNQQEKNMDALLSELYRMASKIDTPETEDDEEFVVENTPGQGQGPDGLEPGEVQDSQAAEAMQGQFDELQSQIAIFRSNYHLEPGDENYNDVKGEAMHTLNELFMKAFAHAHEVRKSRSKLIKRPRSRTRRVPRFM